MSSFYSRTWNRSVNRPLDASIWLPQSSLYDFSERGDSFLGFPQARTISIRRASRASTLPSMEILGDLPDSGSIMPADLIPVTLTLLNRSTSLSRNARIAIIF